ncbi:hypothetical protein P170DRAFT_463913 [Aspergillus steynii IBT 23096]|uniref:Uncharacterized protein n=1 Tax=Aspergillus steynii IBT 23096 TaxID=1392250 RepID=A0A2I2GDC8_9EURO|nr:uncharacterized protein P170DRAFT_463913 [Aspergillus steynii IBT 23096]PLB50827.1 hypothetical protein P170DRAFT_463913 [Aspergillus steynii IBT 23096]
MLSKLVLLTPLLAGHGLAAHYGSHLVGMDIFKRQSEAFVPGTTPGCPDDWPMCGTSGICYNPKQGQTCCPGGKYACPSNSFCLQDPYCCPDGLDPETCAQRYGITLSPSSTEEPVPEPTKTTEPVEPTETVEPTVSKPTDPEPTETAPQPTDTVVPEPTESVPPTTTSNPVIPKPPTSTVPSVPSSTAHPTIPTASPSNPLFTGGANAREVVGGAAIVLGGLGLLGNLI